MLTSSHAMCPWNTRKGTVVSVYSFLVLARYGRKGKRYDTIDITQNIAIRYDTIRCINATSNLTRSDTGVSSSMAGRRSQRNMISAWKRMATPPWMTDRSSAVCGRAQSTTLYKRLFTLGTLTDARQRPLPHVNVHQRPLTCVNARHRTLTDTYNICKCYMLMIIIFSVIIYALFTSSNAN